MAYFNVHFNSDLSEWDVSKVTSLKEGKFFNNYSFVFGRKETSGLHRHLHLVTLTRSLPPASAFYRASMFNADLSNWDVSRVTSLERSK